MTFAQLHDGFYRNPKVRKAGHAASWLWAASIGYASEGLTDGFVPSHDLGLLVSDLEGKALAKAVARLVEVGLWEVVDGGWRIHDYLKWNFSKSAVLAKREATLARVNKHRNGPRHGEGNAVVMRSNASSNAGCNGVTPPVTSGVRNTTPSDPTSSEGSKEPLSGAPSAAPTGAPLELTPPKAKAARAKRPVAPKPPKPSAPFTAGEAVAALAAASGGRFVPADGTPWAPGWGANIARHVQAVPDIAVWTLVGEWIAAGGGYRGTRGMPWVAGGSFLDAVAQSKAWDDGGRYDLVDDRGFPVAPPASCSDANDPWVIAAAKQGIKL